MKRTVEALTDDVFDLLILGGGITGAGVALDAVTRGLRVALIDQGDFASGTSSASSKLVHGGLRYLEHGDFKLVYEALRERRLLLRNAPHQVWPLRFVIPSYRGARVPLWEWRTGLVVYDLLAGSGNLRRSRPVRLPALRREFPGLRTDGLLGGAAYYDAQMDDARLCIEILRTAALQGARVANYMEAVAFEESGGRLTGVRALDRVAGRELTIQARQVLNATGPWVDEVRKLAGVPGTPLLRPTKGVHVIAPDRGLSAAFLLLHPRDGRVFFVIPWLGKTLLGTTDTLFEDEPEKLTVTPEDVTYLLGGFNHHFEPPLQPADILGQFVGLRPLLRSRTDEPSSMSREFRLFPSPNGLLSVAGGKYTTFRHMAEVITDTIVRRLGQRRFCRTRELPLDGTPRQPWEPFLAGETAALSGRHGLSREAAQHLVRRYGRRARDVAAYLEQSPAGAEPVVAGEPDLRAEFAYQRDHEMAVCPEDHLLRRTRLGLFHGELLRQAPSTPGAGLA
jgi:glycerol-3-phosphate dehydrogenase